MDNREPEDDAVVTDDDVDAAVDGVVDSILEDFGAGRWPQVFGDLAMSAPEPEVFDETPGVPMRLVIHGAAGSCRRVVKEKE